VGDHRGSAGGADRDAPDGQDEPALGEVEGAEDGVDGEGLARDERTVWPLWNGQGRIGAVVVVFVMGVTIPGGYSGVK